MTRRLPPAPVGLHLDKDELVVVGETNTLPEGEDWLSEIKVDGWRLAILTDGRGALRLQTRSGQDRTWDFIDPVRDMASCGHALIIDGEVAVPDEHGVTRLEALHRSMREHQVDGLVYYAFDLLHLDGRDLRSLPVERRKRQLMTTLGECWRKSTALQNRLVYVDHMVGRTSALFKAAGDIGCEGIVSKRLGSPYEGGRTPSKTWLKSICAGMAKPDRPRYRSR